MILEKLTPLYTAVTIEVEDGVADAAAIEAAAIDEASAIGPVRIEPKVGAWSMKCPAEAAGCLVPAEREPEMILMRKVNVDSINSDTRDENQAAGRLAIRPMDPQLSVNAGRESRIA